MMTERRDSDVIEVKAFDFARCHSCRSVSGVFGRPLRGIETVNRFEASV